MQAADGPYDPRGRGDRLEVSHPSTPSREHLLRFVCLSLPACLVVSCRGSLLADSLHTRGHRFATPLAVPGRRRVDPITLPLCRLRSSRPRGELGAVSCNASHPLHRSHCMLLFLFSFLTHQPQSPLDCMLYADSASQFDAASQLVHIDTAPPAHIDSTGSVLPREVALSQFSLPYSSHLPPPYPLPLHLAPASAPAPNLLPTPTNDSHPLSLGPSPSSAARTLSPPDSAQSKGKPKAHKPRSDSATNNRNSHIDLNQADPQGGHPQIMVYPPPPPRPGQEYHPLPLFSDDANARRDYSLPSMGSWAPPRVPSPHTRNDVFASHSDTAFPTPPWQPDSLPQSQPQSKPPTSVSSTSPGSKKRPRDRDRARRPSQEEEEAGLALAGLGMGLSAGEMRARRDSTTKKAKVTKSADKEKDGKKSCSECRRLKAKCDRQFPCSNCE